MADEPVQAGPPSTTYRLKKFLRRNRSPVVAGLLFLLALVSGMIGTTVGLLRARESEVRAQNEATRADQQRNKANEQRMVAEDARDRAVDTLDAMTSIVVGDALTQQKALTAEQKQFLSTALEYYRELLKETGATKRPRNGSPPQPFGSV
jgi:hypothetical protein